MKKNKMKQFKLIIGIIAIILVGCKEDDPEFGSLAAPTNLQVTVNVADDNSGNVTLIPTADGELNFHVFFTDESEAVVVTDGEEATFRYTQSGQYDQIINVIAYGRGGVSSSTAVTVSLNVTLVIDEVTLQMITGDGTKNWIWDANNAGHFGVGDPAENFPNFFSAGPNQLNGCLYDDVLTFSHDGNNNYSFQLETNDATFTNWAEVKRFFPNATPVMFQDECLNIDDQIETDTSFVIIENEDATQTLTLTNSTASYWSGAMSYEITELTDNKLVIRGIQEPFDPPGNPLAWYHTFIPEDGGEPACPGGSTGSSGSGNNDVLVWADEFNDDGAPCDGNWGYDLGNGNVGWGNGEVQFYTERPENVKVEGGLLKITAQREDFNDAEFTSARLKTKDKFEFEYGRIEIRAKLPTGGGTWPAIWMLGADIDSNPWPGAGEVDIMEHVGNDQDRIYSTLHFPGNSGGDGIGSSTIEEGVSEEFHVYAANWTPDSIEFSIDGNIFYVFDNDPALPYNKDFFVIMNVAMGGNFGGAIDPDFNQSTLEVDYIRVYQ